MHNISNLQHVGEGLGLFDVDEPVEAQHLPLLRQVGVGNIQQPLRRRLLFVVRVLSPNNNNNNNKR